MKLAIGDSGHRWVQVGVRGIQVVPDKEAPVAPVEAHHRVAVDVDEEGVTFVFSYYYVYPVHAHCSDQ